MCAAYNVAVRCDAAAAATGSLPVAAKLVRPFYHQHVGPPLVTAAAVGAQVAL